MAQVDSGEVVSYLHTDHLGTPRYATNTSGTQVWAWVSDAFGNGAPTGAATVNLRFAGQYWDDESDLHYNWNRYYDPATGRYITSDPIGLAGGLNTYGYALANPVMYTDPEGLVVAQAAAACAAYTPCAVLAGVTIVYVGAKCVEAGQAIGDILNNTADEEKPKKGEEEEKAEEGETPKPEPLPENPDDLKEKGYIETSHPDAKEKGHRTYENPETGDEVRHDAGTEGESGHKRKDHYHRPNPESTSKHDKYLDKDGNPVGKGSDASHIYPEE